MLLYHASRVCIKEPDLKVGRPKLDFGQGFYLTKYFEQAMDWVERRDLDFINVYEFHLEGLNHKDFKDNLVEWFKFTIENRKENLNTNFDSIEGLVLDGKISEAINLDINNVKITEELIRKFKFRFENHQICLRSYKAVENLTFLKAIKVRSETMQLISNKDLNKEYVLVNMSKYLQDNIDFFKDKKLLNIIQDIENLKEFKRYDFADFYEDKKSIKSYAEFFLSHLEEKISSLNWE